MSCMFLEYYVLCVNDFEKGAYFPIYPLDIKEK